MENVILRVADVMDPEYGMVQGIATVAEALELMRARSTGCLVVAKRDEDDEFGLVTTRDIAEHVLAPHRAPERTNVYEIMSKPALSVSPAMNIRYCARLFHRFGISIAPVTEGDRIVGVVTYDQLVLRGLAVQP